MSFYNPFDQFDFQFQKCFLTGEMIATAAPQWRLIPDELLQAGQLQGQQIKLLDERILGYEQLYLPCSIALQQHHLQALQQEVLQAFAQGYAAVKKLDKLTLFNWAGIWVYGFIYQELNGVWAAAKHKNEPLQVPQGLMHKFKNMQLMLQNICTPLRFDGFVPFSIEVFELQENVPFSFRDEVNSLTFSMKMNDFALIAVLQDNGSASIYQQKTLAALQNKALSLLQFEEICARYYYTAYLMNKLPEYDLLNLDGEQLLDARPMAGISNKQIFDPWQNKIYAQVLENFWKPWGYTLFEILKNPEQPMSFL